MFANRLGQNEQLLYRGPSIDASYQVWDYLAKRIQRRRILKISHSESRIAYGGHVSL
jgi:macrodomain Ter protein organizer (MatP/YcbG family)